MPEMSSICSEGVYSVPSHNPAVNAGAAAVRTGIGADTAGEAKATLLPATVTAIAAVSESRRTSGLRREPDTVIKASLSRHFGSGKVAWIPKATPPSAHFREDRLIAFGNQPVTRWQCSACFKKVHPIVEPPYAA